MQVACQTQDLVGYVEDGSIEFPRQRMTNRSNIEPCVYCAESNRVVCLIAQETGPTLLRLFFLAMLCLDLDPENGSASMERRPTPSLERKRLTGTLRLMLVHTHICFLVLMLTPINQGMLDRQS